MRDIRASERFELIVFDWDGTIMDSIGTIVACARRSAEDLGYEPPPEAQVRDLVGLRLDTIARELFGPRGEAGQRRWIERYSHHWIHTFHRDLRPLPGALDTVEHLEKHEFLLAVATGKSRRGLDRDLHTTGLGPRFLATRTVDESPAKPSPQMLLELMQELGARPERTLMVGDTTHDIQMARNANVPSLGVLTGSHHRDQLIEAGAAACISSVAELPAWLEEAS